MIQSVRFAAVACLLATVQGFAQVEQAAVQRIRDQAQPSLVAIQYTWESEFGRREFIGAGIVVSADGLIMAPMALFDYRIPDDQMKQFKLLVPTADDVDEVDAVFQGRDERANVAFIRAKEKRAWTPVKFVSTELRVGQPVVSVGLLPKAAGYRTYAEVGQVSAKLRGEIPQILVTGGLTAVGSPVFDLQGQAIGYVHFEADQPIALNDERSPLAAVSRPPILFTPASDFLGSLQDPPTGKPLALPWIGVVHANGLRKELAEYVGLKGQPAIEIGDVVPGAPADKAGLKAGMIITRVNGRPLERGDEPRELPMILNRQILRMKIGEVVKLTVLTGKGQEKEFAVKLDDMPGRTNQAPRYYAEDLGFVVRESVLMDTYMRRLAADAGGVVVAAIRPQGPAQTAKLEGGDMIVEVNGETVKNLEQFRQFYSEARTAKPREAVVIVVLREGRNQTLRLEPPQ